MLPVEDEEDLELVREIAASEPELSVEEQVAVSDELSAQVDPVTCILIAGAAMFVAKAIHSWWSARQGGLVIDQRPGASKPVYRDKDVPAGYVVVYPPDGGKVQVKTLDEPKDSVERLLEAIISGGLGTVKSVADAASQL